MASLPDGYTIKLDPVVPGAGHVVAHVTAPYPRVPPRTVTKKAERMVKVRARGIGSWRWELFDGETDERIRDVDRVVIIAIPHDVTVAKLRHVEDGVERYERVVVEFI